MIERSPLPESSVTIPPPIFDQLGQLIESRRMIHVLRKGQMIAHQLRLTQFVKNVGETIRHIDRTLGPDWQDKNPAAFNKGQHLALILGELWLQPDELEHLPRELSILFSPFNTEYNAEDPDQGRYELADDIMNLGSLGLAKVNGLENFIDAHIDKIEYDVSAHSSLKAGAGLMALGIIGVRERMMLESLQNCDLDSELDDLINGE